MSAILERLRKPTADPIPLEKHGGILQQATSDYIDYKAAAMEIGNHGSKTYRLLKFLHLL